MFFFSLQNIFFKLQMSLSILFSFCNVANNWHMYICIRVHIWIPQRKNCLMMKAWLGTWGVKTTKSKNNKTPKPHATHSLVQRVAKDNDIKRTWSSSPEEEKKREIASNPLFSSLEWKIFLQTIHPFLLGVISFIAFPQRVKQGSW